nr:MAG TPA: baseplate assembly protein [Caudoviricetes sp.]
MALFDEDNTADALNSIIKIGEVSSVDPTNGTARVVFDDDDSIVSGDLQVLQKNTFKNQDFAMPDVGEDVVCLFLPSGTEEGFILGSVYSGEVVPPETSIDKRAVVFSDETKISYDRAAHSLTVKIGKTTITADGENVNINGGSVVNVKGASSVNVEGAAITLKGPVTIDGTLSVSGAVTAQSGASVTGDVTATGDVVGAGKSLSTHTHTGNMGAPTSPPL